MTPSRTDRLDAYQRRHRWLGFPLAVVYKAADDRALYLAALVTYYAFVSLFPLILLFVSIMGFVLEAHPHLRGQIVNSAVEHVPGIGKLLRQNVQEIKGSAGAVAIGVVGLLYGALGAMQSAQAAFNEIYAVPRNEQPNPLRSRKRSFGLLGLLGTAVLVTSGINVAVSTSNGLSTQMDDGVKVLAFALSAVISVALFSAAFTMLTATDLRLRHVITGGLISGAGWDLLQAFGSRYVYHEAQHGSALYGVFGVVLATVAWLYLVSLVVMISAEVNVVLTRRLWPRSLLSPFTDQIDPTPADLTAYASYARARRFKGFQRIDVSFPWHEPQGREDPPPSQDVTPPV